MLQRLAFGFDPGIMISNPRHGMDVAPAIATADSRQMNAPTTPPALSVRSCWQDDGARHAQSAESYGWNGGVWPQIGDKRQASQSRKSMR